MASGSLSCELGKISANSERRRLMTERILAAEVLELGQTLFDTLIESAIAPGSAENQVAVDAAQARAASDEFFVALRLLLGLAERDA